MSPAEIAQVFGGDENYRIIKSAPTIRTCRLHLREESLQAPQQKYEYDEGPYLTVIAEQAHQFRDLLDNIESDNLTLSCTPIYGVRLRFEADDKQVDIDLCFRCNILTTYRNGTAVGGELFNSIRPELVALCKTWFPGDPEIQELEPDGY